MFRNYLIAAIANLQRNWLYAGVTILGLAVGFAATIVISLYVRDESSFDRFLPGHERVYRLESQLLLPGKAPQPHAVVTADTAGQLKLDFPQVQRVARVSGSSVSVRRDDVVGSEPLAWVDPDFFRIMPFPVLAGDPNAAVQVSDGLVLTREAALKYFGEDAPIGKTLEINPSLDAAGWLPPDELKMLSSYHPLRVMAVLKNPPSSSHLRATIYAAGRSPYSGMSIDQRHPQPFSFSELAYVQLKPGASADAVRAGLAVFAQRHFPSPAGDTSVFGFRLTPLTSLHFTDAADGPHDILSPPGDRRVDLGVAVVGLLIVVIAMINFVTLVTARSARRAVEVGVRKVVGARRHDLVLQFMAEALVQMAITMLIAIALAELALPYANAFLQRSLRFDYFADPLLAAVLVAAVLATTLLAGLYPALVLSSFRPATALKGAMGQSLGAANVRQALVVAQFAILIGLMVVTATVYRQTDFALHDAMRADTAQVVIAPASCDSAFAREASALPGVKAASCASPAAVGAGQISTAALLPDRSMLHIDITPIDVGFLELHGLKPLAGRFFSPAYGEDMVLDHPSPGSQAQPSIVLNESAARALGYADPAKSVGKSVSWARNLPPAGPPPFQASQVVGVVRDFTLGSIRTPIRPTIYFAAPRQLPLVVLKLDGRSIPETLIAMNRLWRATGHSRPLAYEFETQAFQEIYHDVIVQGAAIAVCSGLAILIACLGLFALAAFTTERRTKEIGVRKAMGASTFDVVRLLLWQFTQPVLWANLIAWPLAWWVMRGWLDGFAYRVDLPIWLFLSATVAAVAIAWLTVSVHAWLVARARPVTALRYE